MSSADQEISTGGTGTGVQTIVKEVIKEMTVVRTPPNPLACLLNALSMLVAIYAAELKAWYQQSALSGRHCPQDIATSTINIAKKLLRLKGPIKSTGGRRVPTWYVKYGMLYRYGR